MKNYCILVSGLPASGKTTAALALAKGLGLRCFDKDDILEFLFAKYGVGDAEWRQKLSRESDIEFQRQVTLLESAVVVSHWRALGSNENTGTPTEWLLHHFNSVLQVHCNCAPELAASRFSSRTRHPGHLDALRSRSDVLNWMEKLATQPRLQLPTRFEIEVADEQQLRALIHKIKQSLSA